jgi:hypothetical protein
MLLGLVKAVAESNYDRLLLVQSAPQMKLAVHFLE